MGYTLVEFGRVLNSGFTNEASPYRCQPVKTSSWLVSQLNSAFQAEIELQEKPARVYGSLSLPVLKVTFRVTDSTQLEVDQFFEKFFKYFHKGGG